MIAVILTGGKQYLVTPGKKIKIEKLPEKKRAAVVFDKVLLVHDKELIIGTPLIKGAEVTGDVVRVARHDKVVVGKFRPKKRTKKKKGHRQHYTEVLIKDIKA